MLREVSSVGFSSVFFSRKSLKSKCRDIYMDSNAHLINADASSLCGRHWTMRQVIVSLQAAHGRNRARELCQEPGKFFSSAPEFVLYKFQAMTHVS